MTQKRTTALYKNLALAAVLVLTAASAQADDDGKRRFSHASGFICGNGPTNNRFVTGDHRAAFNILNTSRNTQVVRLELGLSFPNDAPDSAFTPGATFSLDDVVLTTGKAVMIDCDELVGATPFTIGGSPPYISGVLDVRSRRPLAVTLHQTAGPVGAGVSTVSVTRVPAVRAR